MAKILIVDDQPDNLYVLDRLLTKEGHAVLQADRGQVALEMAQQEIPDLILLDVMMPGLDGFEVVRRLREAPETSGIPVILLTANAPDQRLKVQGLNLGADEYLTQPINNSELLARIRALLRTKQAQNELIAANRRLQAVDREREEFISIVSHELKNPLASIKGYAALLLRRAHKDPALASSVKGLEVIEQQANRMTTLLDQLRDVSHIGFNRFAISPELIDLAQLVEKSARDGQATTSQHMIEVDIRQSPIPVNADEFRLQQVLDNLVGNAIKYSPDGGPVEVVAQVSEGLEPAPGRPPIPAGCAVVTVRDHGVGIPEAERERLFDRFFRASNVKGRAVGMGLGLFIAHEIVSRHGGIIWAESEEDRGSLFGIALPPPADQPAAGDAADPAAPAAGA